MVVRIIDKKFSGQRRGQQFIQIFSLIIITINRSNSETLSWVSIHYYKQFATKKKNMESHLDGHPSRCTKLQSSVIKIETS